MPVDNPLTNNIVHKTAPPQGQNLLNLQEPAVEKQNPLRDLARIPDNPDKPDGC